MFNWFRTKAKKKLQPIDFSVIKTDMHSHFIPKIDDGSPNLDVSIEMIKKMKELGYSKLITTPHVMSDFYKNTPEIIKNGLAILKKELDQKCIKIDLDIAAEYYIDYDFQQKIGKEKLLTFGDNYILIEFSFLEPPKNLNDIIFKLQLNGYKVVLAHPERYTFFTQKDYDDLKSKNVFFQLNLLSLIGHYSPRVREQAIQLINLNQINFIGTDCHNMNHAKLYEKCQIEPAWHQLVDSGMLLNQSL